jgi:hypothetical protein
MRGKTRTALAATAVAALTGGLPTATATTAVAAPGEDTTAGTPALGQTFAH